MMQTKTEVLIERVGPLATLTLNRPDKLNALSRGLIADLTAAFASLLSDAPRVVVVTGAGPKAFCAGADIEEMSGMTTAEAKARADAGQTLCAAIEMLACPVIAAVNGFALGGGCELALACDFIYSSDRAKFGQPEVNLGVIPGFGGTQRLARRVGIGRARELIYSGAIIDAPKALAIGLVNEVVAHDDLLSRVRTLAEQIAEKAPLAVAQAKRVMLRGVPGDLSLANELEAQAFATLFGTEDQKEGMKAFAEKRKAEFRGR
ncbi:MAG TPA: enoyl-CoA hydratase-related protein [Polyangiaceae bacterium]